jgi:hypothetical protein
LFQLQFFIGRTGIGTTVHHRSTITVPTTTAAVLSLFQDSPATVIAALRVLLSLIFIPITPYPLVLSVNIRRHVAIEGSASIFLYMATPAAVFSDISNFEEQTGGE